MFWPSWDTPPPPPRPQPAGARPGAGYPHRTDAAVRYLPVTVDDQVMGYLWASVTGDAAGYVRRMVDPLHRSLDAALVWLERLAQAQEAGVTPLEALRRWVGAAPDPQAGAILPDAMAREAESLDALKELANPDAPPDLPDLPPPPPGYLADGTPLNRASRPRDQDASEPLMGNRWGGLLLRAVHAPGYAGTAAGPVRYAPVTAGETVLGYLWASDEEGAAGYIERGDAGDAGWNAGTPALRRLREARERGLPPSEALGEGETSSLAALRELAGPLPPPAVAQTPSGTPGAVPAGLNTVQRAAYDYTRAPDVHNGLLQAADPPARLAELLADPARAAQLTRIFGSRPRYGDFAERFRLIDQAVAAPLPEGLETLRGIDTLPHPDARALVDGVYTEPGYLSVSLGSTPAFDAAYWLHLTVPAGTPALWMGRHSHFPGERELILPRDLRLRIEDAYRREGRCHIEARIVAR